MHPLAATVFAPFHLQFVTIAFIFAASFSVFHVLTQLEQIGLEQNPKQTLKFKRNVAAHRTDRIKMVALRKSSNSWLVSLVTLILSCSLFVRLASSDWQSIDLMANRVYRLHWRLDGEQLRFRVEVKSRGYFSLGVSPTGTMTSADLVTGYIHANGSAILHVSLQLFDIIT